MSRTIVKCCTLLQCGEYASINIHLIYAFFRLIYSKQMNLTIAYSLQDLFFFWKEYSSVALQGLSKIPTRVKSFQTFIMARVTYIHTYSDQLLKLIIYAEFIRILWEWSCVKLTNKYPGLVNNFVFVINLIPSMIKISSGFIRVSRIHVRIGGTAYIRQVCTPDFWPNYHTISVSDIQRHKGLANS